MQQNQEQLIQLVYVSAATSAFADENLEELLTDARKNNKQLNITGLLLYTDRTFFQVLEGYEAEVRDLYQKIECDPRHNNVLILAESRIAERNFSEWSMGFRTGREDIEEVPGFVDFFSQETAYNCFVGLNGDTDRITQILEGFRRGRWRREAIAI